MSKYTEISGYIQAIHDTLEKLECNQKSELIEVISAIQKVKDKNKTIFVFGNGGSSATASHFACDLTKFIGVKVLCLSDNTPTVLAIANDRDYEHIFVDQLKLFMDEGDLTIGFSGSGNSKNVIEALKYATTSGRGTAIAVTGFDGGMLTVNTDICLIVPSDNMQQIEDVHLIITHLIMTILRDVKC